MANGTPPVSPTTPNGGALIALLGPGSDKIIQMVIVALVAISGGGNFFATKQAADINIAELNKAIQEIHDIHNVLDTTVQRQKEILDLLQKTANKQ